MATYVIGNAVANATSYELFEKGDGSYNSLATASEINFEVSALGLEEGDHILVVKAMADGYSDSAYSNEVTYTVEAGEEWYVTEYDASKCTSASVASLGMFAHSPEVATAYAGKTANALRLAVATSGTLSYGKVSDTALTVVGTLNVTAGDTVQTFNIEPITFAEGERFCIQATTDTATYRFGGGVRFYIKVKDTYLTGDRMDSSGMGIDLGYIPA